MAIKKTIILDVNSKQAVDGINEVDESIQGVNESTESLDNTVDGFTGGAVSKFKSFGNSIKGVATSFKSLKVAIIASGIGALAIGILAIVQAFKRSEEGQNKFAKIMGVIGAVTDQFLDLLALLGDKLISAFENPKAALNSFVKLLKDQVINRFTGLLELIPQLGKAIGLLFQGKFGESGKVAADAVGKVTLGVEDLTDKINEATEAMTDLINETIREGEIAANIADKRAKADKLDRELTVERAIADRNIADLRFKSEQRQQFSAQERIKFLKQASAIEDAITAKEITSAKLRRDAIVAENELGLSTKEALDAEAEAKAEVIRLDTQRLTLQKRLQTSITTFENEAISSRKASLKSAKEVQKLAGESELDQLQGIEDAKLKILDTSARTKEINDKAASDKEIAITKLTSNQKIAIIGQTFGAVAEILGKNSAAGKAAGIAQALINTYQGITQVWKSESVLPEPFATISKIASTATVAASGFAAVKQIKSVKLPAGSPSVGGGGGSGSLSASAPAAPQFNVVGSSSTNQLAESISQQQNEPIKAFVVGKDVTSQQEMDRSIVKTATFG